jgi:metal-responsive CopG/Arc/MetJ family transcriptional regulator
MQSISLKLEKGLANEIERVMKEHHYSTKTEFIREAIRKHLNELEDKKTERENVKAQKTPRIRKIAIIQREESINGEEMLEDIVRMKGIS